MESKIFKIEKKLKRKTIKGRRDNSSESKKGNLFRLAFLILLCFITYFCQITNINAGTGLSVQLLNQNPDPVTPGSYVYLNVKVANSGSDIINKISIKFINNENFRAAPGYDDEFFIGPLSPYSSEDESSFSVVKFKVFVAEGIPSGLNTVNFLINVNGATMKYKFNVLVQDDNPNLIISSVSEDFFRPGKCQTLSFNVKNPNSVLLKDISINLDLENIDEKVISVLGNSNEKTLDNLKPKEKTKTNFNICINPNAESKPYLIPVNLKYKDSLGKKFEKKVYLSINVFSEPNIYAMLYSQDKLIPNVEGKVTIGIANAGPSSVKGVVIKILDDKDYRVIEGANQYVGDLNADDFQTLQSKILVTNPDKEKIELKVKMIFKNSYEKKIEQTISIPLIVKSTFAKGKSKTTFFSYFIVALISSLITFFIVRKIFVKKLKKIGKNQA